MHSFESSEPPAHMSGTSSRSSSSEAVVTAVDAEVDVASATQAPGDCGAKLGGDVVI